MAQGFMKTHNSKFTGTVILDSSSTEQSRGTCNCHSMTMINLQHCRKKGFSCPEVCMAIDHHSSLNELIRIFQKVMSGDHTSIMDQDRGLANFLSDPLSCQVDIFSLPHITGVGKNLQVTMGQNFLLSTPSLQRRGVLLPPPGGGRCGAPRPPSLPCSAS